MNNLKRSLKCFFLKFMRVFVRVKTLKSKLQWLNKIDKCNNVTFQYGM